MFSRPGSARRPFSARTLPANLRTETCEKHSGERAGIFLQQSGREVKVQQVDPESPFHGRLFPGDVLHAVTGVTDAGQELSSKSAKTASGIAKIFLAAARLTLSVETPGGTPGCTAENQAAAATPVALPMASAPAVTTPLRPIFPKAVAEPTTSSHHVPSRQADYTEVMAFEDVSDDDV